MITKFCPLRWLPSIAWMGFIFFLSTRQTTGITGDAGFHIISLYWQRFFILKTFHLIEYGTLLIFVYLALLNWKKAFLFSYLFALSDEFHQHFTPGRTPKLTDTFIDLLGMILGLLAFHLAKKIFPQLISRLFS